MTRFSILLHFFETEKKNVLWPFVFTVRVSESVVIDVPFHFVRSTFPFGHSGINIVALCILDSNEMSTGVAIIPIHLI